MQNGKNLIRFHEKNRIFVLVTGQNNLELIRKGDKIMSQKNSTSNNMSSNTTKENSKNSTKNSSQNASKNSSQNSSKNSTQSEKDCYNSTNE